MGKERDEESGLYYYGARYYAAWTCRFISVDPLVGKYSHQSSYVHADNNPINKVDHNGEGTDGDGGKTAAARTGGTTATNNGGSGGCTTCTQTNATDKPAASTPPPIPTGPPPEAKLYDAAAADSPGAWKHSEGFQAGAETKKGLDDYEKSGGKSTIVKIGIVFDKLIAPELQNIGVGVHLQKQSGPPLRIVTEKVDFSKLTLSPVQPKPTNFAPNAPMPKTEGSSQAASPIKDGPIKLNVGYKSFSELGLKDGIELNSSQILGLAEQFLGKGYAQDPKREGRFVSSDGQRAVLIGDSHITGQHGGGNHVNFHTLAPNPNKPGKMMITQNIHVYFKN